MTSMTRVLSGFRRTLILLGLLCSGWLALSATGSAHAQTPTTAPAAVDEQDTGGWPRRIQGMPADFHRGAEGGYYFWHDDSGLHLWLTDPENVDSHYTGTISTDGTLTAVSLERPESDDGYQQLGGGMLQFDLQTHSGVDGLNFEVVGGAGTKLELDLHRDGHATATDHIWEGIDGVHPENNPLTLHRR